MEEEEIVITAKLKAEPESDPGGYYNWHISYTNNQWLYDLFAQTGGGQTMQVIEITQVEGAVLVKLPGINFPLRVPSADWGRMSASERAAFLKTMTEFAESPKLKEALDHYSAEGIVEIEVHYDNQPYGLDGTTSGSFAPGEQGRVVYSAQSGSGGTNLTSGTKIVISINSSEVNGAAELSLTLLHELRHPFVPGVNGSDEAQVELDASRMYNDIWRTDGSLESLDGYSGSRTIVGSQYNDTATGSGGNDTMSGLSGNDSFNGGAGDDYLLGGAGMDHLTGGSGSNSLEGGLEADTYVSSVGSTGDGIYDIGGVDRLDVSRMSLNAVTITRWGDSLQVTVNATGETVFVSEQWVDSKRIEQFTFAEGTYAASYIESLAGYPGGVCYDPMGQPMFCQSYGLPVVLDLDGDGIELIEIGQSRTKFDVDGDGKSERIGWVSGDDGILALDRNGNGRIDDFTEMSFRQDFRGAGTDLEGLMAYDSNGDGFLTAADERWGEFVIWTDTNGNGKSEAKELFGLTELGIVSIDLERRDVRALDGDADSNQVLATSVFETADGARHLVGDVALFADIRPPELPSPPDCGCHFA